MTELQTQTRVAIVDDHSMVVAGLEQLLGVRPELSVVWRGPSISELLTSDTVAEIVLLDLDLGQERVGAREVRALVNRGSTVIIVSAFATPDSVREVYYAGASGVVAKSEPPEVLIAAIDRAISGDDSITPSVAGALANASPDHSLPLSVQELRVLALYGSGLKISAVARNMGIQPNTVKEYLKRIRLKLADAGRPSPTQRDLYREALRRGILKE